MAPSKLPLLASLLCFGPAAAKIKYDTSGSPKEGVLNVHIVPHTHDDAGWLKTVDEYYMGQNNSIQHAGVRYILDSVVKSLEENPDRKFVYVEQAFFQRWWRRQSNEVRDLTRRLIKNGQLTMINGAWVMHDEATPHYMDMVDQTTLGHRFLMQEFGVMPSIGWQIDPFGHSATQAALLSAEVGFTGLFFGRIDYQDLALRVQNQQPEFIWRASSSLGQSAQVFTGLTGSYGGNYQPPAGFCWDVHCDDEPIQDDPTLENNNVKSRIDEFVAACLVQANQTRGQHIMMTMGSDFQYEASDNWYVNLDKLIHYLNKDGRVNAFYSNPEIYLAEKAKEAHSWPLKTDDFFPYADGPHQFWTGYFTSRPSLKRFVRDASGFFQLSKQMVAFGRPGEGAEVLEPLAEAMGLLQHHDAVSGTEKQHTAFDYAKRLEAARLLAEAEDSKALAELTGSDGQTFSFCARRNVSICEASQKATASNSPVSFIVWNGLSQARSELIELPVANTQAKVLDSDGKAVASQIVESLPSITDYGKQAEGAPYTLLFRADLPAMGYSTYRLETGSSKVPEKSASVTDGGAVLENEHLKVTFCDNGRMCEISSKDGPTIKVNQDWFWYLPSTGNDDSSQASGAYIFRPEKNEADQVFSGDATLTGVQGDLASEVIQEFGDFVTQRVRLAKGEQHIEVTYTVHRLPLDDGKGKEMVSRITTDIKSGGSCLTDSNGREMLRRQKDFRPTWNISQTEPVAGNYFPITTALAIRDDTAQLTVLTDASQGGTGCLQDGALEMMVNRRLLKDDSRGVGEPLNETEGVQPYVGGTHGEHFGAPLVVRGRHLLVVAAPKSAAAVWRPLQDRLYLPATPAFSSGDVGKTKFSAFTAPLPTNVQLVTMEPLEPYTVLVRLAHQFGADEDAELSQPATVDVAKLFQDRKVAEVEEMALTGTILKSDMEKRRISWRVDGEEPLPAPAKSAVSDGTKVTLGPLQIRTFRVKFAAKVAEVVV